MDSSTRQSPKRAGMTRSSWTGGCASATRLVGVAIQAPTEPVAISSAMAALSRKRLRMDRFLAPRAGVDKGLKQPAHRQHQQQRGEKHHDPCELVQKPLPRRIPEVVGDE